MSDKEKCERCKKWKPARFVNPMHINQGQVRVCVICANDLMPGGLQGEVSTYLLEGQRAWEAERGKKS